MLSKTELLFVGSMAICLSLSWLPTSVAAQQIPQTMWISVAETDEDSRACEISKNSIEGAVQAALRYNRLELTDNILYPFVQVEHLTMRLRDGLCITRVSVSIERFDTFPLSDGNFNFGTFRYCDSGSMISGSNHGSRLNDAIRDHLNECLSEISTVEEPSIARIIAQASNELE